MDVLACIFIQLAETWANVLFLYKIQIPHNKEQVKPKKQESSSYRGCNRWICQDQPCCPQVSKHCHGSERVGPGSFVWSLCHGGCPLSLTLYPQSPAPSVLNLVHTEVPCAPLLTQLTAKLDSALFIRVWWHWSPQLMGGLNDLSDNDKKKSNLYLSLQREVSLSK